jgi:CyaY protein
MTKYELLEVPLSNVCTVNIMTESEYIQLTEDLFTRIEQVIDDSGVDVECNLSGSVLTIEFGDCSQVIVNRHSPYQEVWLAAKSGAYHFFLQDGKWLSRRDDSEFYSKLSEVVRLGCGEKVSFV